MLFKILKKDFLKKKTLTLILLMFIVLSAFLVASGASMVTKLTGSLNYLFVKSSTPQFVQLHTGVLDPAIINRWTADNPFVKESQIVEMMNVEGSAIYLGHSDRSEESSVMSFDFVTQNYAFDFLLNLEGQVIHPEPNEIAVPVYFMQKNNLKIGDKVKIINQDFDKEFTIVAFVRDAVMNPSIIHSKRFVINQVDFTSLKDKVNQIGHLQYLIEFQLFNLNHLSEFTREYQSSELPQMGPTIDYHLIKILNSVTDGIVIGILILVSLLLTIVALLCLRLTILAAIEEDYRQIGVMKALGIPSFYIRNMYLVKYIALAALASVIGYVGSLYLGPIFEANMMLYLGSAPKDGWQQLPSLLAVSLIFLLVICFCALMVSRFNQISAVKALRVSTNGDQRKVKKFFSIDANKLFNLNIFLGLRDVVQRYRLFFLLFFVFFICAFIVIVPLNFLTTIQSSSFMNYMGVGKSDLRIDLQQGNDTIKHFDRLMKHLKNDKDIEKYDAFTTSRFKMINSHGMSENMNIEMSQFSSFPIQYLEGSAPINEQQIALSYLYSQQLEKKVGDSIHLLIGGKLKEIRVSGIYQDITNGGLTAKALFRSDPATVLRHVVNIDLKPQVNIQNKVKEYAELLHPARVTDLTVYLSQTLGDLIKQIKVMTFLAVTVGVFVSALIASLFLKMLIAKDYRQLAIMKAIGFSINQLRMQYMTRTLSVLCASILMGTLSSYTLGQTMISLMWSFMGAPAIKFIIIPVITYIFCPLILIVAVAIATFFSMASIDRINIVEMIVE